MFLPDMASLGILKHIETSRSFTKGSLSWNQTQNIYHFSHSFFARITNLLTGRSRYRRAILVVPDIPSMSLTLLTHPFLSRFVGNIFAIGRLIRFAATSLSMAISPYLLFLLIVFHFCRH